MSTLEKIIENSEDYAFTGEDIKNATDNKYKLYVYEDLTNVEDINELLGENKGFILLFQNESENSGHWVSCFLQGETLMFFDSYGLKPDEEIQYADYNLRKFEHSHEKVPHLTHILNQSNYKISYNKFKLQRFKDHTNTCGRWATYRLMHRDLSHEQFANLFMKNKCYNPDFWISMVTGHLGSWQN